MSSKQSQEIPKSVMDALKKEVLNEIQHYTCCICEMNCEGYGNNPAPIKALREHKKCCDTCNREWVIPCRLYNYAIDRNQKEGSRAGLYADFTFDKFMECVQDAISTASSQHDQEGPFPTFAQMAGFYLPSINDISGP
jgi:hypothetical protein